MDDAFFMCFGEGVADLGEDVNDTGGRHGTKAGDELAEVDSFE